MLQYLDSAVEEFERRSRMAASPAVREQLQTVAQLVSGYRFPLVPVPRLETIFVPLNATSFAVRV